MSFLLTAPGVFHAHRGAVWRRGTRAGLEYPSPNQGNEHPWRYSNAQRRTKAKIFIDLALAVMYTQLNQ